MDQRANGSLGMLAIRMKIFSGLVILLLVSACQSTSKSKKDVHVKSIHQKRVELYQKVYGITEQEAEFRLSENHITEFRQVHKCVKEKSGFASFMVKHTPVYKVEAYFKEQAIQKLASCTSNSLFKAFDTGFSHADLEAAFNDAKAKLKSENLTAWGQIIPYGSDHRGYSELETSEYFNGCLLYTSPSPRDRTRSRMPSSA